MGFVRITAASHRTHIADPATNAQEMIRCLAEFADSKIVVFGELSLTGYTCGDLFAQDALLDSALEALKTVAESTSKSGQLVVVGLPLRFENHLYNCAVAINRGHVVAIVPKQFLPNYQEFYEVRWFAAADGSEPNVVELPGFGNVPFGIDLLIQSGEAIIGIEICEDLWMPIPPSSIQATAGANILLNLSASNELVGKAAWREVLVRSQSGRCLAAYAYASAGPSESTTDVVFGAQCMVAENGSILANSDRIGLNGRGWIDTSTATADIDLQRLNHDRQVTGSWQQSGKRSAADFRRIDLRCLPEQEPHNKSVSSGIGSSDGTRRTVVATPFVPQDGPELHERCAEIFGIQCAGLA